MAISEWTTPQEAEELLVQEIARLKSEAAGAPETMREGLGAEGANMPALEGRREELNELFQRVMRGSVPRNRALKPNEPDRLDERHLQVILLRSAGMDQGRIAQLTGFTQPWISIILNHPDAEFVLAKLVSYASDNMLDMNKRIAATAHEAFNVVVEVMRTSADDKVRSHNAFEILKMAGYGAVQKVQHTGSITGLTDEGAKELAQAIREFKDIEPLEYAEFVDAHVVPALSAGGDAPTANPVDGTGTVAGDAGEPPISGSEQHTTIAAA